MNKKALFLMVAVVAGLVTYRHFHTEETLEEDVLDATGIPTHACPRCGERVFKVLVSFENYEIATYSLDGYCATCGTYCTMPTALDHQEAL